MQRLMEIFGIASELRGTEREAYLDQACAEDPALRVDVESLLEAHDAAGPFLHQPTPNLETVTGSPLGEHPWAEYPGQLVGRYKLLEQIGEGGFGTVWLAQQSEPVTRRVAVKVIKPGMDTRQVIARFEAERQALAMMDHPNIAKVFDGGSTENDRPYFVMEYIRGVPILAYCDTERLDPRARLGLFAQACSAVQHAHQKGIIHRDIKPSNVMITLHDGEPVVKVIDFGIAKATNAELTTKTLFTQHHQMLGTPAYMSPEQAEMSGLDIDTRTDIYSLGVLLYELLTGTTPFTTEELMRKGLAEMMRIIREDEPPKPSTRFSSLGEIATHTASRRHVDPRRLGTLLRGDLDWIVMKCLDKDRARRYDTANGLADDVRRYLEDQPITAGPPSASYRVRKFIKRNRAGVAVAVVVTTALGLGFGGAAAGALRIRDAEAAARALRPQADEYDARLLLEQADALWPPYPTPEMLGALEDWQVAARLLIRRLPEHRARLAELNRRAHEAGLRDAGADAADRGRPSNPDDPVDRSSRELLTTLVRELEQLGDDGLGLLAENAVIPGRGWSIPKRLAFARGLATDFAEGGSCAEAWDEARSAIPRALTDLNADGVAEELAYPGLNLQPQMGLLPLGPDPESGLWEFAHLMTGTPPVRGDDRQLVLTEETGLVLVLIPGGTFRMGSEARNSSPAHDVALSPYFMSKYEMTQGQWKRITGENPSAYGPDAEWDLDWLASGEPPSLLLPVEQMSWRSCDYWMPRAGLSLPSEAQWERAARAGTQTTFSTGPDIDSLRGVANVRDARFERAKIEGWARYQSDFEDGSVVQWAVGTHLPNGFGLHDVHGNVWEWCLDAYAPYRENGDRIEVDPVVPGSSDARYVYRGGSWRNMAESASSATRYFDPPDSSGSARGIRPARAVTQ